MEKKTYSKDDPLIGQKLLNKFTLIKKLGEGSFGSIYSAKSQHNWYAVKLESRKHGQNLLENEACIMCYLRGKRIPSIKSYGSDSHFNILIMELMGKSLEEIFESLPKKKMTVNCVAKLGLQMIQILEYIHDKHIIHRDIKPDNFVMGRGEKSKYLYLLDFGLAKKYRSSTTLNHYRMVKKKNLTGTARYASINALNGLTQSRRDDLEAVGYVLMYFLRGKLPWQGLRVKNKEDRYHRIMEIKKETTPDELCRGFPKEFKEYIKYTRGLEYEQDPDYDMLKNLFKDILLSDKNYLENLYTYDWDIDNKNLNTITTSNTSHKAIFDKDDKEKNFILNFNTHYKKKFINKINAINEGYNSNKKYEDNNFSIKAKDTKENFYSSQILYCPNYSKIMNTETKIMSYKNNKYLKDDSKEKKNDIDDDFEYQNIMDMTDEGKSDDIKKLPNNFGYIHSKGQLEKQTIIKKNEEESKCIIF